MIYLIKSAGYDKDNNYIDILKIGYTTNIKKRLSLYKDSNPTCSLISLREGSLEEEQYLIFKFYKYRFIKNEWFYYNQEIIDNFLEPIKDPFDLPLSKIKEIVEDNYLFSRIPNIYKEGIYSKLEEYVNVGELSELEYDYYISTTFEQRMSSVCELFKNNPNSSFIESIMNTDYMKYINILGIEEIIKCSYRKDHIESKYQNYCNYKLSEKKFFDKIVIDFIYDKLKLGKSYTYKEIKEIFYQVKSLYNIYTKISYKEFLNIYFNFKRIQISKNRIRSIKYNLLSKKI